MEASASMPKALNTIHVQHMFRNVDLFYNNASGFAFLLLVLSNLAQTHSGTQYVCAVMKLQRFLFSSFYIRQRHDIDHGTGCKRRTDINSLVYAKEITRSVSNFRKHKIYESWRKQYFRPEAEYGNMRRLEPHLKLFMWFGSFNKLAPTCCKERNKQNS
jgi:hypothetical protein